MGKPAARSTDIVKTCNDPADLPVSQIIAVGTVLINGLPAAKQNDQVVGVDTHIIMVPSPGGPVPTPIPHPYSGILNSNLSTSVKIMGQPAAMQGSKSQNMPPHIPCGPGPFQKPPSNMGEVMMGSPNVMIGDGGGGGGGGSGGGGSTQAETSAGELVVGHQLNVKFVDKGGNPITGVKYEVKSPDNKKFDGVLAGEVKKTVEKEGSYEIALQAVTSAKWSKDKARSGEKVKMLVETAGIDDGAKAEISVWLRDGNRADKKIFTAGDLAVKGGKIESEWTYEYEEEDDKESEKKVMKGYSSPQFYFTVKVNDINARSGMLFYKDFVEIELRHPDGKAAKDEPYLLFLANGEVRKGKLDSKGYAREEKIPPGRCSLKFPEAGEVGDES